MVKALAEQYFTLPSEVLRRSPGELYLDFCVTFAKEEEARPPRDRQPDDPSFTALLARLRTGQVHG